jgi:hypothetical protein
MNEKYSSCNSVPSAFFDVQQNDAAIARLAAYRHKIATDV